MKQAYDGYNGIEGEKPNQDIYVEELKKVVDQQLDDIRKAIGAPEDSEVSVTQKEDGETVVEVDGKEVQTEEAKPEAKAEVEIDTEGEAEESDPEELAKLEEELLKMAK
jgi:chaperonin cofactor prefoldin